MTSEPCSVGLVTTEIAATLHSCFILRGKHRPGHWISLQAGTTANCRPIDTLKVDLMTAVSFRNFSVLVGNNEPTVTAFLRVIIRQACEGRAVPHFTVAGRLEELLNAAQLDRFDFCILIVNNIFVGTDWSKKRIERVIESTRLLKPDGRMPVLAISAYRDGPGFEQRALEAGAFALLD